MRPRLFHVSEDDSLQRFEPRPVPSPDAGVEGLAVWAVADSHLVNYLFPRDCPRICFRAGPGTSTSDRARFLGGTERIVAFESAWLARVESTELTLYDMPAEAFEEANPEAGYWISRSAVTPSGKRKVRHLMSRLLEAGVEVRILQDFWPLADAVAQSTLRFSIIRKRNAQPRSG